MSFRIAEAPDAGRFDLQSSSWELIEEVEAVAAALSASDWPAAALLGMSRSVVTTAEGVEVASRRPTLNLVS
ncbi:hypothetical protein ABT263_26335 [Kitasatospora sp. NPDC001603]|uniref:hypothetical protein n=1 Tax=Kitasatospora sp. NPDC001603 TaxID=3154388 RepID=UPI003329651E